MERNNSASLYVLKTLLFCGPRSLEECFCSLCGCFSFPKIAPQPDVKRPLRRDGWTDNTRSRTRCSQRNCCTAISYLLTSPSSPQLIPKRNVAPRLSPVSAHALLRGVVRSLPPLPAQCQWLRLGEFRERQSVDRRQWQLVDGLKCALVLRVLTCVGVLYLLRRTTTST